MVNQRINHSRSRWTSAASRRLLEYAGNPARVEEAVRIVGQRLLMGISCPPTDLEALKSRLNVTAIEPVEGLPVSGELRVDGRGFRIVHAASLSSGRRRFTVAHEFGHAFFESTGPNCPRYGRELERLCDMLASEFLMPCNIFVERSGTDPSPRKIFRLAREFDTSVMATSLKCRHLFGLSIFQIENDKLAWGFGTVRSQQDLQSDAELRSAVASAMNGNAGECSVSLGRFDYALQWEAVYRQRRALFVLKKLQGSRGSSRVGATRIVDEVQ